MTDTISVIIPHFNRAELLHDTLRSLQQQTAGTWEAIVVDDGSTCEQWQMAQAFSDPRVKFIQRTTAPKGPSRCRNLGLDHARSNWVMFLDSDDLTGPWCLRQRLDAISSADPANDYLVFPVLLFHHRPGDLNRLWNSWKNNDDLNRFLQSDPPWHTSSPVWKRESLLSLGGFNESVMYGDDSDLHMRALVAKLTYTRQLQALPDVFIRRSDDTRITNTVSSELIQSRLTRLEQGSRFLASSGTPGQKMTWAGQYFVEAEFLLFNVENSQAAQRRVWDSWCRLHMPGVSERIAARLYFLTANITRVHAYFLLRIARRLAKLILPKSFFPQPGEFESARLDNETMSRIQQKLVQQVS